MLLKIRVCDTLGSSHNYTRTRFDSRFSSEHTKPCVRFSVAQYANSMGREETSCFSLLFFFFFFENYTRISSSCMYPYNVKIFDIFLLKLRRNVSLNSSVPSTIYYSLILCLSFSFSLLRQVSEPKERKWNFNVTLHYVTNTTHVSKIQRRDPVSSRDEPLQLHSCRSNSRGSENASTYTVRE